ncbi:tautomerase family protein [Actinomycetospora chiangmaiensis]|uniref:tautomerase family protein n=1 Tax=Actinomycetospora chiangmaiensis TaxID=402650 RepID=UPI00037FD52E|nr:tautomerase family protein [Actinomycetospora chiangmaiensis]
MPYYQFTVPTGGATLQHKAEIAAVMTKVHGEVTGAPSSYVQCSFTEVPAGSLFAAGEPVTGPRLVGLIRAGRSEETRRRLIAEIAEAWTGITGDAVEDLAIFVVEMPGANVMEGGVILPEAADDPGAIL